jgi:hypothetical protein
MAGKEDSARNSGAVGGGSAPAEEVEAEGISRRILGEKEMEKGVL